VVFEALIAGLVRRVVVLAGSVSEATKFDGEWDVGVAVTHLKGTVSHFRLNNWFRTADELPGYPGSTYSRTWRGPTSALSEPDGVVTSLIGPFNRTLM
jgi:hypothetical protein